LVFKDDDTIEETLYVQNLKVPVENASHFLEKLENATKVDDTFSKKSFCQDSDNILERMTTLLYQTEQAGVPVFNFSMHRFKTCQRNRCDLSEVHDSKILQIWKGGWIKGTQKNAEFLTALARAIEKNDPAATTLESYIDKVEYVGQCPGQIIYSRPASYQNDSLICQAHAVAEISGYTFALADNYWEGGYTFEQVVQIIEELLSRCDVTKQEIYGCWTR
jgi:hypothetical protein